MELKTVIIVTDIGYVNGGQAKVAVDSARILADSGIQVAFFAAVGPLADELRHPNINTLILDEQDILNDPNRVRAMVKGIWNLRVQKKLREYLTKFDPNSSIVHCHGYIKANSSSIGPVLDNCGLPVVFTMHDYFLTCPNGGFYDYQRREICTRKPLGMDCLTTNCDSRHMVHKMWRVGRQAIAQNIGGMPHKLKHVIYLSAKQKTVLEPLLGKSLTYHYLPNPIPDIIQKATNWWDNKPLAYVGRLSLEKGVVQLATAMRQTGQDITFVGDGPLEPTLKELCPSAQFTGWASFTDIQRTLCSSKALIFPSEWYETFGLTVAEALACGIPVVCGKWTAAAELVHEGVNGTLIENNTVQSIKDAISRLQSLPRRPIKFDHSKFSPINHLKQLTKVYTQIRAEFSNQTFPK